MRDNRWTFLTNHGHVLLCIAADPAIRLRDVANKVGITERAAQRIVADLVEGGYLDTSKRGRRNVYQVNGLLPLRHPIEEQNQVAALLALIEPGSLPAGRHLLALEQAGDKPEPLVRDVTLLSQQAPQDTVLPVSRRK